MQNQCNLWNNLASQYDHNFLRNKYQTEINSQISRATSPKMIIIFIIPSKKDDIINCTFCSSEYLFLVELKINSMNANHDRKVWKEFLS